MCAMIQRYRAERHNQHTTLKSDAKLKNFAKTKSKTDRMESKLYCGAYSYFVF